MFQPRKILILLGALLSIFGGYSAWRAAHPPLNDEQQLTANVEAIRAAAASRDSRTISSYLDKDFSWDGHNKRELNSLLTGAFMEGRDFTANVTGLQVSVTGETATTTGKFSLAFRSSPDARAQAYVGDFKFFWQKQNGNWIVTKAEGGENIGS